MRHQSSIVITRGFLNFDTNSVIIAWYLNTFNIWMGGQEKCGNHTFLNPSLRPLTISISKLLSSTLLWRGRRLEERGMGWWRCAGGGRGEQGRCQRTDIHQSGAAAAAGTTRKPLVGPHSRHKACIQVESSIILLIWILIRYCTFWSPRFYKVDIKYY